jgi:diguanylate cyclase (GGDEF)-like protein
MMPFIQRHRLFLTLSLLLALTASIFYGISYFQLKERLHSEEQDLASGYFSAFNIAYQATQNNMLQVANVFAHTPKYQELFLNGKHAVQAEGGGAGKEKSQQARQALYRAVLSNWQQLNVKFHARVLQFHLGPASTSFLRVHKPQKFGDNMDTVRHTIVDTNKFQRAVKGFETGRVYSGIRGTSPVSYTNKEGRLEHVGAVEAGVSFSIVLENLLSQFDVNAAILLSEEHLKQNVWPDILQKMITQSPLINGSYIDQTTSNQINNLASLNTTHQHSGAQIGDVNVKILSLNGREYLYASQPLRDYQGSTNPQKIDAGKVVIWQDITTMYAALNNDLFTSLYYALAAFFIIECLLFWAMRSVSTRLNAVIHQQQEHRQELEQIAHYDPLTKLPNRTLFKDRFNQAIAHSKRSNTLLAVCFLDLDHFKPINDNFGHEVGDKLLLKVAERIQSTLREEDSVSRQGGDEFAILLSDLQTSAQCMLLLKRLHQALAQPYIIDGHSHVISASSGTTLYPLDNADLDTLLRHADHAMYRAKLVGRNAYHLFDTSDDQKIILLQNKLQEIDRALTHNEFQLYYQPKVNMRTGEVFGAEALIRWIHPEKGLIPPLDFLPIIDGTDLEIKIGEWVIDQALNQVSDWYQQGIELEVSVNISSFHLQSSSFIAHIEDALARYPEIDPAHFQLELLESSALGDLQTIGKIIKTCQNDLGVHIALDDFGTGYSSLTHLRNLSANTIKIDQSFVKKMLDDPNDYSIIDGLIGLADAFNRDVIAEGVETTNHGIMLLLMGCESAQGYGIARPMPANDLTAWLSSYKPNQQWLEHASIKRSNKETKLALVKLTTLYWWEKFNLKLKAAQESGSKRWPYISHKKCHHGAWIKRAKKERVFDENWLSALEHDHEAMHSVAEKLIHKYQANESNITADDLNEVRKAFDKMIYALDHFSIQENATANELMSAPLPYVAKG